MQKEKLSSQELTLFKYVMNVQQAPIKVARVDNQGLWAKPNKLNLCSSFFFLPL